jgi:hypothetical protein
MIVAPRWITPGWLLFVLLLGVFLLRLPGMVVLSAAILLEVAAVLLGLGERFLDRAQYPTAPGALVVPVIAVLVALLFVRSRDRLGLQGAAGDLMLVDLRDRLVEHGQIPPLPRPWRVDSVVRSAYAQAFSGDFVVAALSQGGTVLELVLVDVSGKGQEAGVRSLLLSGAFGGLLGATPRRHFLPTANAYLLAQRWEEGFATAIHLAVDLETGTYWVSTAGHPPAVQLHAGSGLIETIDTVGGPALGVVDDPEFRVHQGMLRHGDALMLYTDGLVERPGSDVDRGIDRLMGKAEELVSTRSGGAEAVLTGVRAGESDDRALILVYRD